MKHRGLLFLLIFAIALAGVYAQPILFPKQVSAPRSTDNNLDGVGTSLQAKPLAAAGYAGMIGKGTDALEEEFGLPKRSYNSGFGFYVNVYQKDQRYMEVDIVDEKVAAIKVLGEGLQHLGPFEMNMTMNDLSKLTMIYPNFTIDRDGEEIVFELMEEDMNYRPLIVFDNQTYGILFFNQMSGELFGVMYLNQDMLLKLAPYTLVSGHLPTFEKQEVAWPDVDRVKEEQAYQVLNLLRRSDELKSYRTNFTLQGKADDLLLGLAEKPEELLGAEVGETFRSAMENENNTHFSLVSDDLKKVLSQLKLGEQINGVMQTPVYDVMFQLMTAYSDPYLHNRFMVEEEQATGVGIQQQNMVILLEDAITKTEDSDKK